MLPGDPDPLRIDLLPVTHIALSARDGRTGTHTSKYRSNVSRLVSGVSIL